MDPQTTDPDAIGAAVTDGAVTLTGHVPTYAEKLAGARAAERVYRSWRWPTSQALCGWSMRLITALVPRAVTLAGRVMWLCTASSSLVTKRTSERERWTNEE